MMKNKLIIFILSILFFSCKTPSSTTPGHDCSSFQIITVDSIFISGEHIHLLPECLCSYEDDEWFYVEENLNDYNNLIKD